MTKIRTLVFAAIATLVAAVAVAATVNVSWINATQNTDNSAIPATGPGSIVSTRITWGTCNGTDFGTRSGEVVVDGAATAAQLELPVGTWCAYAQHSNTYGVESDPSNIAQRTIAPPRPRAPSGFTLG